MARPRVRLSVDDRRRQLLELGMRAFTEKPYQAVSTDDIAARAGISRGLLFHYFPSKRDYYLAVVRLAADELVRETVWQAEGPLADRLVAGLRAYFRFVEEHAGAYATLLRAGGGADPAVQELVEATRRRFVEAIRAHLAPPSAPPSSARLLRASLRAWIGLVEALALDFTDHRDLGREELVELATRAIALVVPGAAGALEPRRTRARKAT